MLFVAFVVLSFLFLEGKGFCTSHTLGSTNYQFTNYFASKVECEEICGKFDTCFAFSHHGLDQRCRLYSGEDVPVIEGPVVFVQQDSECFLKKPAGCCDEQTIECLSCKEGVSVEEYCVKTPHIRACQVPQCCSEDTA